MKSLFFIHGQSVLLVLVWEKKIISKKAFFSKNKTLTPEDELKILMKKYKLIQKEKCLGGMTWDSGYLEADQVKFKQLYLAGCDLRLLENKSIDFTLENLELIK